MGRKRLPLDLKKEKLSISLPKWMIDKLREKDNYNKFIYDILSVHVKKDDFIK
jgi:hypothetical protein